MTLIDFIEILETIPIEYRKTEIKILSDENLKDVEIVYLPKTTENIGIFANSISADLSKYPRSFRPLVVIGADLLDNLSKSPKYLHKDK